MGGTVDQQAAKFKADLGRSVRGVEQQMLAEWAASWKTIGERIDEATARIARDQAELGRLKRSLFGLRGDKKTAAEALIARLETTLPGLRAAVVRDQEWQDEIAVKMSTLADRMADWVTDAQEQLIEDAQAQGHALGYAGWLDRANDLRREIARKTHDVMDVAWGMQKVGVPGKGDWAIAKKQGLYMTRVKGQRLYAQKREDAEPLINYLKAGGEYGTPEFSRLLGYTEQEILEYRAFLHAQKMSSMGTLVGWGRPSVGAIEHLVGRSMDGGMLAERFRTLGEGTWDGMRTKLVEGMALGQNPAVVARAMKKAFGYGLSDNMRLARTEMINSYRQASLMTYRENSDIIQGYRWNAELGPRTCQACIALHGTEFTLHQTESTTRKGGTGPAGKDTAGTAHWVKPGLPEPEQPKRVGGIAPVGKDTTTERAKDFLTGALGPNRGNQTWKNASWAAKGEVKKTICDTLAQRTGIEAENVNHFIKQWAYSSNDNDMRSLAVQQSASDEFGVPMSEYTLGKIEMVQNRIKNMVDDQMRYEGKDADRAEVLRDILETTPGFQSLLPDAQQRVLLNAMYNNTQNMLASAGFAPGDTIRLRRGVGFDHETAGGWKRGDVVDLAGNALESWSVAKSAAKSFAQTMIADYGVVLEMDVPIEMIMGTARTGFGCMSEGEFVLMGSLESRARVEWMNQRSR